MKNFKRADFDKHFDALGIKPKSNIVVHSQLLSFGLCEPATILEAFLEKIGSSGTLAVPTYVFDTETPFDRNSSKPTRMGSFSLELWKKTGSIRSACPVHSHAAYGLSAQGLTETKATSSFGQGTDFDFFYQNNFDLVLLGCTFGKGATFLHHLEALAEVPYREWVYSPKKVIKDGVVSEVPFYYFERNSEDLIENFDIIADELGDKLTCVKAPYGNSYRVSLSDLSDFTMKLLRKNPYYLMERKNE